MYELCNLLGILALSAKPGHAGIPVGHAVQDKGRTCFFYELRVAVQVSQVPCTKLGRRMRE